MAFKKVAHLAQAKARRPIPRRFGGFEVEALSDEEYLDLLRRNVTRYEQQLFAMSKRDSRRAEIARQKQILSEEIAVHRNLKKRKGPGALANEFMNVVRQNISKDDFEMYLMIANKNLNPDEPSTPAVTNGRCL